jgi:hypothetical protein
LPWLELCPWLPVPRRLRTYGDTAQIVRDELADDPTVDITTIGRRTSAARRIEIWMLDVDGRFFTTGTPGGRGWLAKLIANYPPLPARPSGPLPGHTSPKP